MQVFLTTKPRLLFSPLHQNAFFFKMYHISTMLACGRDYVDIRIYTYTYVYICVCIYIHTHTVYICICVYICIYTMSLIHIYTYIWQEFIP